MEIILVNQTIYLCIYFKKLNATKRIWITGIIKSNDKSNQKQHIRNCPCKDLKMY